jgi:hypothetical protein
MSISRDCPGPIRQFHVGESIPVKGEPLDLLESRNLASVDRSALIPDVHRCSARMSPRLLGCHFVCVGSRRRAISPPKRREGDERYRSPDSCGGSSPHAATCRPFVARRLLRLANEADRALLGFLKRNPKATRARTREWISEKLGRTISFDLIDSFADRHRHRFPKVRSSSMPSRRGRRCSTTSERILGPPPTTCGTCHCRKLNPASKRSRIG